MKLTAVKPPDIRYARSGDLAIAYQVIGEGPLDLVFCPFNLNLFYAWEVPQFAGLLKRLATFSRLILFDHRGTGLSDHPRDLPTLEARMDDIRKVMDAVDSEQSALVGALEGGHLTALFAATYPERTSALILFNPSARDLQAPDHPWGLSAEEWRARLREIREGWGSRELSDKFVASMYPSLAADENFLKHMVAYSRLWASPGAAHAYFRMAMETDVRDVLPAVRVPTQEIAHAFGLKHAPCGNPSNVDPNYPTYDSYPSGSIGEFGLDSATLQTFDPASTFDFMSYCAPVAVSPYTYTLLKNNITASPAAAHPDRAGGRAVKREYLYLNYRLYRTGKVELLPSFVLEGIAPPEVGLESDIGCDLLGPKGELLESHSCSITNPHMDPNGPIVEFHEAVPWSDDAHSIVFRRGDEVCHTLEIEGAAPEVTVQPVKRIEREPSVARIEWAEKRQARAAARARTTYHVRYSNDGGETWRGVAADLTEPKLVVNLDVLPGGDQCIFEVLASSGIRTSAARTDPIDLPVRPREAHILSPKSGSSFSPGGDVIFVGGGFSPDFETVDYEDVIWTSSRDGMIGIGFQVVTNGLSLGRHRITASIPDGMGGEARANVFVTIR